LRSEVELKESSEEGKVEQRKQRVCYACTKESVLPDLSNLRKEFLHRLLEASTELCVLETQSTRKMFSKILEIN